MAKPKDMEAKLEERLEKVIADAKLKKEKAKEKKKYMARRAVYAKKRLEQLNTKKEFDNKVFQEELSDLINNDDLMKMKRKLYKRAYYTENSKRCSKQSLECYYRRKNNGNKSTGQ